MFWFPGSPAMRAGRPSNSRGVAWASLPRCNPWGMAGAQGTRGADLWPCPEDAVSDHPARRDRQPTCTAGASALTRAGCVQVLGCSASASTWGIFPSLPQNHPQPRQPITHFLFPSPSFLFITDKEQRLKKKKKGFFLISSAPSSKAKKICYFSLGLVTVLYQILIKITELPPKRSQKNSLCPPSQLEVPCAVGKTLLIPLPPPPTLSHPALPTYLGLPILGGHVSNTCSRSCGSTEIPLPGKGIQIGTFRSQMENKSLLFNRTVKDSFIF